MANDPVPAAGTSFGDRVRDRLTTDPVIWLTTVGKDGTPQPNPVWFLWDGGDSLLVYNRTDANRLTHVKDRARVSLNFDGDGQGADIIVLTGNAEVVDGYPLAHENAEYMTKYQQRAERISNGSAAEFAARYPVVLKVTITKVRGF